jgi:hypothetical protein
MLNIPLSAENEAKLRQRAAVAGKDVAEYVLQIVEEDLAITEVALPASPASPLKEDPWLDEFHAWVASHPRLDYVADDSRESIYAGRGE